MGRGKQKIIWATLVLSTAAFGAVDVAAQESNSPSAGNLSFATSLRIDSNPSLAAVSTGITLDVSETLSFGLKSETRTQIFDISGSADLTFSKALGGGASSTSFDNPTVNFRYFREAPNSNLDLNASYSNSNVNSAFDADPSASVSIIVDSGTVSKTGAGLSFNWGVNAPLGFSLNASLSATDYTGTSNPALFDSSTEIFGGAIDLRLSPSTNGTLSAKQTNYSSSDSFSTSSQTTDYNFMVSHELARALTLSGNVGFRVKSTTASGATSNSSGFLTGIDLVQSLPNGSTFGGLQVDMTGIARNTALTFGRQLDLPRGSLSASITADVTAGSPVQVLASAAYQQDLPDGSISLDLSQSLSTNYLGEDVKYSTIGIAYQKALNSNSGLNLSIDFSRSEDGGTGTAPTLERATMSAAYSRAITPNWDMAVGYTHRNNTGSAIATARSDSLFLALTRDLQFGF